MIKVILFYSFILKNRFVTIVSYLLFRSYFYLIFMSLFCFIYRIPFVLFYYTIFLLGSKPIKAQILDPFQPILQAQNSTKPTKIKPTQQPQVWPKQACTGRSNQGPLPQLLPLTAHEPNDCLVFFSSHVHVMHAPYATLPWSGHFPSAQASLFHPLACPSSQPISRNPAPTVSFSSSDPCPHPQAPVCFSSTPPIDQAPHAQQKLHPALRTVASYTDPLYMQHPRASYAPATARMLHHCPMQSLQAAPFSVLQDLPTSTQAFPHGA